MVFLGKNDQKMLRHSGRPPSQAAAAAPRDARDSEGRPGTYNRQPFPSANAPDPRPPRDTLVQNARPGPPGAQGELRTHSHLMIQVPPAALPSLPRTKQTALTHIKGRGHGTLCRPEPRSGLLCAATASSAGPVAPSLSWPRVGGRAHSAVEEREGDRASPSINSLDRWARLEGPQGWSN